MSNPLQPAEGQAEAVGTLLKYREGGTFAGFALIELRAVMLADDPESKNSEDGFDMHYCVRTIQMMAGPALDMTQTCSVRTTMETYHHDMEFAEYQTEHAVSVFLQMIPGSWMDKQWKMP